MRIYVAEARAAWSRSAEGEGDSSGYRCPKSATLLLRPRLEVNRERQCFQ
jgi:hypothetical protein